MSELKDRIRKEMTAAMKARDKERTNTLRMLVSEIGNEETKGSKHELTDQDVLAVVAREIKKRKEYAEIYEQNGRPELAENELAEAKVISEFQPTQLSDDELASLVAEVVKDNPSMGPAMKAAKEKAAGRVDGKRLSEAVRAELAKLA